MGGGRSYYQSPGEREAEAERYRKAAEEKLKNRNDDRRKFSERAVMILVDYINDQIIRPGPTPEERECYDMAQELHDIKPELVGLIVAMLDVSDGIACTYGCDRNSLYRNCTAKLLDGKKDG